MKKVLALLIADLHLSHTPPVARSAEPDWYAAMQRPLDELRGLSGKYNAPIICAGDVFDKWNACPELINWAVENLPTIYAIPGQHDLPLHGLEDIRKSAYWTLLEAGTLYVVQRKAGKAIDGLMLFAHPFGVPVNRRTRRVGDGGRLCVSVAHSYVWTKGNSYEGAPDEKHLFSYINRLEGYDVAVFGDNHRGFSCKIDDCTVVNCGCLIRRRRDERGYSPSVGLLYNDGRVERRPLDTSDDKWLENDVMPELVEDGDLDGFLRELDKMDAGRVEFEDSVRRHVADGEVSKGVGDVLLAALEDAGKSLGGTKDG